MLFIYDHIRQVSETSDDYTLNYNGVLFKPGIRETVITIVLNDKDERFDLFKDRSDYHIRISGTEYTYDDMVKNPDKICQIVEQDKVKTMLDKLNGIQ